jgi:polyamine oxidase
MLSHAGITDLLILEATDRIGGRIRKTEFAGMNVEMGANWVEGVNMDPADKILKEVNPIWSMVHHKLKLNTSLSNYSHLSSNTYMEEYVCTVTKKIKLNLGIDVLHVFKKP